MDSGSDSSDLLDRLVHRAIRKCVGRDGNGLHQGVDTLEFLNSKGDLPHQPSVADPSTRSEPAVQLFQSLVVSAPIEPTPPSQPDSQEQRIRCKMRC